MRVYACMNSKSYNALRGEDGEGRMVGISDRCQVGRTLKTVQSAPKTTCYVNVCAAVAPAPTTKIQVYVSQRNLKKYAPCMEN